MGIVETLDGRVADIAAAAAAGAAESKRRHPPRRADRRSAGSIGAVRAGGAERAGRRGGASLPPRRGGGGISRADGSAGWLVGIGIGSNYLAGILPEQTAKEVFRDVTRPGAGPFAPGGAPRSAATGT
jgi:hypothetical protein